MNLKLFIQEFLKRKGAYVFLAVVIAKILSFVLSVIIIRILPKNDYGNLMYAYTIISFTMPFMGMGVFQGFIKYAPIQKFLYQRKSLFQYSIIKGSIASSILVILIILFSRLATKNLPEAHQYLIGFSFLILSLFIFEAVKNYLRIFFLNKAYAKLEIIHAVFTFVLGIVFSYFIGALGFIIALVSTPLFLSIWLLSKKQILRKKTTLLSINKKQFWIYGLYTSLGGLVSQLIFSVDVLSIGNMLNNSESLAQYKAISLIPFSLLFLPTSMLKTDFVKLVQEAKNRLYLINYFKNFALIFSTISIILLLLTYFWGNSFISLFFGASYLDQSNLLFIFMIGISGAFIFRVPFGNLMAAIGWTKINTLISIATLITDVILNYFWIQKWGIIGAAYATSLLLWLSGFATFIVFLVYLSKLKKQ